MNFVTSINNVIQSLSLRTHYRRQSLASGGGKESFRGHIASDTLRKTLVTAPPRGIFLWGQPPPPRWRRWHTLYFSRFRPWGFRRQNDLQMWRKSSTVSSIRGTDGQIDGKVIYIIISRLCTCHFRQKPKQNNKTKTGKTTDYLRLNIHWND